MSSRIADVHNGSSLFSGGAGRGKGNIRRWIINNDWLEATVALLLNMFYNSGIASDVWVLRSRKSEQRKRKYQPLDVPKRNTPLHHNLGTKKVGLSEDYSHLIPGFSLSFEETEQPKVFPRETFAYWKVTVECPLRIERVDPGLPYIAKRIRELPGRAARSESAAPGMNKTHKKGVDQNPILGLFQATVDGKPPVIVYELDTKLRGAELVPLLGEDGVESFLRQVVLPYAPNAWHFPGSVKIGYEIRFTHYLSHPRTLRPLKETRADILASERKTEGLIVEILGAERRGW